MAGGYGKSTNGLVSSSSESVEKGFVDFNIKKGNEMLARVFVVGVEGDVSVCEAKF